MKLFSCLLAALLAWMPYAFPADRFLDPLDTPARRVTNVSSRPLMALAQAGTRFVAVGLRGLIIGSDDGGKTWTQANVPVESDLLAVQFPDARNGWVVGHDGVILHSADGGVTWQKQLDGRLAADRFKAFYTAMGEDGAKYLASVERNYTAGPVLPFLDVWFEDTQHGYVVGSFGMITATSDGGKTWEPWLHRIDNPDSLNFNAIRGVGKDIYIAGEHGQIYHLDHSASRFVRTDTGYNGSFFGIAGNGSALVAYGLRGTVYRADVAGKKSLTWQKLTMPNEQTLVSGIARKNGEFALANAVGDIFSLDATAANPKLFKIAEKLLGVTSIAAADDQTIIATGLDRIHRVSLPVR